MVVLWVDALDIFATGTSDEGLTALCCLFTPEDELIARRGPCVIVSWVLLHNAKRDQTIVCLGEAVELRPQATLDAWSGELVRIGVC